jgi:hypothetical protein
MGARFGPDPVRRRRWARGVKEFSRRFSKFFQETGDGGLVSEKRMLE